MIELPIYNREGKKVDQIKIDEEILGSRIRPALLKQAIVMYHANRRQGSAATKSRGMVVGSTAKLYRQKGTGRARAGASRTVVRRGGGVAFAKLPRDFRQKMPQKQRRLARNSAILAKLKSNDTLVIDELSFESPKTSEFSGILGNLNINRSCLVAIRKFDTNLHKSVRNIPRVDAVEISQLNAGEILNRKTLLFTREALEALISSADRPVASEETAPEETK
jgi:large subunit ribosomal protein L4